MKLHWIDIIVYLGYLAFLGLAIVTAPHKPPGDFLFNPEESLAYQIQWYGFEHAEAMVEKNHGLSVRNIGLSCF